MSIRLNAEWMQQCDERILEVLEGEGWVHPRFISRFAGIHLSYRLVQRRLRMLADGGLVAPHDDDYDLYHITGDGRRYLNGERDQALHPHPLYYGLATTEQSSPMCEVRKG